MELNKLSGINYNMQSYGREFKLLKVYQTKNIENENFKIRFKKIFKKEIYKN
jgi:hypothetical protein